MTVDIGHLVEVSFDGVGGAALIAFISALYERRRSAANSVNTPKAAGVASEGRLRTWIYLAGVVFIVSVGAGAIFHFSFRTSLPSVANRGIEPSTSPIHARPLTQTPRNEPLGEGTIPPKRLQPKRVATTADEITALVAEQLQLGRAEVKPEKDLVLDLGATPLDKAEIVMAIETSYDIQIPDKDVRTFKSVGDIINYMERREHTAETPH
jgi:acyl carrier protein